MDTQTPALAALIHDLALTDPLELSSTDARDRIRRGLSADRSKLVDFLRGVRHDLELDEPSDSPRTAHIEHRVALIEDDDVDARVTETLLARAGDGSFTVTRFKSIPAAEFHLREGASEIVLLDLGLPGISSEDVVATVRQLAPATPLVVLSGNGDEARAIQALQDGAQDYVVKGSLDADLLGRTVRLALARAESERSLRLSVVKLLVRSDELFAEIETRTAVEDQLIEEQDRLSQVIAQLEKANLVQAEFLATVSHELRTPLTSIIGYSDLLRDIPEVSTSDVAVGALDVMDRNSGRLLSLIEDLLITAEVDSGITRMKRERVSVADVLETVAETIRPLAQARAHTLSMDLDEQLPLLWGDKGQLERAFVNLVGNAIKFTAPGGEVRVAAHGIDETVEITVSDSGPGIEPDDVPKLFNRFTRGRQAVADEVPGTGLGLAIVKSIVEGHLGDISVISDVGIGTAFTVTIPTDLRAAAERTTRFTPDHAEHLGAQQ